MEKQTNETKVRISSRLIYIFLTAMIVLSFSLTLLNTYRTNLMEELYENRYQLFNLTALSLDKRLKLMEAKQNTIE